jgi:hypothetical protein
MGSRGAKLGMEGLASAVRGFSGGHVEPVAVMAQRLL